MIEFDFLKLYLMKPPCQYCSRHQHFATLRRKNPTLHVDIITILCYNDCVNLQLYHHHHHLSKQCPI